MKPLGQCLYKHNGRLYGEFRIFGRRTKRRLQAIAVRAGREEIARKKSDHARARMRLCPDPFAPPVTIASLIRGYRDAGCPDRKRQPRSGVALNACLHNLETLTAFWGSMQPEEITMGACDRYHDARVGQVTRGAGHRTVEIELCTLSNLLTWAARADYCRFNPLAAGRPSYRVAGDVRHCNAVMPESDDELHMLANHIMEDPRGEVLGWQLLLEALTGCRTSEILRLRWDAIKVGAAGQPGYQDETSLYVKRSKHGIFPYILKDASPQNSALREVLLALRAWHDDRFPTSPWYLPGRSPQEPVDQHSLGHALARACPLLDLPHRTSHGLRAFHVRALRSLGIDDSEIAKRLGQRSGVGLVERVYGRSEPGWFGSGKIDFRPDPAGDIPCAWVKWLATDTKIIPISLSCIPA
jgi:integrase